MLDILLPRLRRRRRIDDEYMRDGLSRYNMANQSVQSHRKIHSNDSTHTCPYRQIDWKKRRRQDVSWQKRARPINLAKQERRGKDEIRALSMKRKEEKRM